MPRATRLALVAPFVAPLWAVSPAHADEQCVNVKVELTPAHSLQLVAWLEQADGTFVDTLYITAKTGLYGMGNRPGRFDFNSGPVPDPNKGIDDMWPYGRRVTTFPVWAHRHGMTWPEVIFQDEAENNLSHSVSQSSIEVTPPYCRPLSSDGNFQCWNASDKTIWDTGTCATRVHTDKGKFSPTRTSLYPPRADLTPQVEDSPSVALFRMMNPFDAISRATPAGGQPLAINWPVPPGLPGGDYVLYVEASKGFDFNGTYNPTTYPAPTNISYASCGQPYRGQPSVIYRVPFTVSGEQSVATVRDYVGYGDPDGASGTLNPPDTSISTDTPGSGALRLQLVSDGGEMFRVRVSNIPQLDYAPPDAPAQLEPFTIGSSTATLRFIEPGDDGLVGPVAGYEIRMRANSDITEDNFAESMTVLTNVVPDGPGQLATVQVQGLLPETEYSIAVRAFDDCHNKSPIAVTRFTTADRVVGTVDACFVATAAYGSTMANDVDDLRHFRDAILGRTVFGELAIETYYTFGPALAGIVGESETLRQTTRTLLAPIVTRVRRMAP
jgi:hypothetical protein